MTHNRYDYSLDIFEKETKKFVRSFFYEKKMGRIRWIAVVLLVPIIILANSLLTWAGVSYYYSPLCLGSWAHVKNVEGEPQLALGADASEFNSSNSAILKNAGGQIYCGKFQTNDEVQNEPKSLKLKFSLMVTDEGIKQIKTEELQNGGILDGDYNQGAIFIIPVSNPEESVEKPKPEKETSEPSSLPASSTPEPSPSPEVQLPEPQATPEPEMKQPIETPTPTPEPTIMLEPSVNPTESPVSILKNIFFIPVAVADENTETSESLNLDDLIDIKYSYDGENWNYLGRINRNNWKNISFDLPIDSVDQISQLQISLSSLPTIDSNTSIYLDSIWLEAEYDSGVVSFVKDIAQTIIETVTLQNLDENLAVESPVVTPQSAVKTKKIISEFNVSGSVKKLVANNDNDDVKIDSDIKNKEINISGNCEDKYYVIAIYPTKDAYAENPSSAIYVATFPCDGRSFSHKLNILPETTNSGDYYLVIGKQSEKSSWQPVSDIYKIEFVKKEVEQ